MAAEGCKSYSFETLCDLETFVENQENVSLLVVGDEFYVAESNPANYIWNGTEVQPIASSSTVPDNVKSYVSSAISSAITLVLNTEV